MTTPDLKTCCQIWGPGVKKGGPNNLGDARAVAAWDEFCEKAGGVDAVNNRRAKVW